MAQKQVLLDVKVNLKESIKEIAELKLQQADLIQQEKQHKATIKELEQAIDEQAKNGVAASEAQIKALSDERAALVLAEERRKALNKEIGEQSRKVQNTIVAEEKYKGTLKGLCAQLSIAKDELRAMKLEDPGYAEKAEEVAVLNERIKEMEAAYGVYSRNVGNYGMAVQSTKDEIQECVARLAELTAAGKQNSEEFAEMKSKLDEYNKELQEGGNNTMDFATNGLGAMVGAMTIAQQVMGDESAEGQQLAKVMQKLQIAVMAVSAATQLYQAVQKKGLIQKVAENIQVKAGAAAIKLEAKARTQAAGATVVQTVAQKALNAAMKANPILLIVAAVVALVTGLVALFKWVSSNTSAQKEATNASLALENQTRRTAGAIAKLDAELMENTVSITREYQNRIKAMMKAGATAEKIAAAENEMNAAVREEERKRNEQVLLEQQKEFLAAQKNYNEQKKLLDELIRKKGENAKKTKEQAQVEAEAYQAMEEKRLAVSTTEKAVQDSELESAKEAYDKQVEYAEKAYDRMMKAFESRTALVEQLHRKRTAFMYDETKSAEENAAEQWRMEMTYEAQLFAYQQKREAQSLALQRKNNKITAEEYKAALALLEAESQNFAIQQSENIKAHMRELTAGAIELAGGKTLDAQLKDSRSKFAAAEKAIREDAALSAEEKSFYLVALAEKSAQDEKSIRLAYNESTSNEILAKLKETYKNDLRQWSDNESERLQLEIEQQQILIEEKKKAGQRTLEDEVALMQKEAQLRAVLADEELIRSWKDADEQYRIHKEYLEKELELDSLSAEQRSMLEAQLADLVVENNHRKLDSMENYATQSMDLLSSINDLWNTISDAQISKEEAKNDKAKSDLDKRLKAGTISQQKYDKEVAKLDEELDKKKAKIARQQAIRERALNAMKIVMDTATAIMRIWADVPKIDFGVSTGVLTGIASGIGAAQLATVLAAPLPQARKGGLVKGATHEQGGVLIETEGDERIVSANASRAFPELLNLISYIGKHSNIPDTGYATRALTSSEAGGSSSSSVNEDSLAEKIGNRIASEIKGLKIYTAITDVREADRNYTEMENIAKQ